MILCKVVGSIVATIKHDSYDHQKILLVRPVTPEGELKSGTMVAVDTVGAGEGNIVLVASEGARRWKFWAFLPVSLYVA